MGRPARIGPLKAKPGRRRDLWPSLIPVFGLSLAFLLLFASLFTLYGVRGRACPPGPYVFGSTPIATALAVLSWWFGGMMAGAALAGFVLDRLPWRVAKQVNSRPKRSQFHQLTSIGSKFAGGAMAAATVLWIYAALVGFCAGPSGITYKSFPWSDATSYRWGDVAQATVVCYGSGRGGYSSFALTMADGSDIELADFVSASTGGYVSVRTMLRRNSVPYDDSEIRGNCNSVLRDLRWP